MKIIYHPKSPLEKFGLKVYNELVENFPQTFFVGGMVRDVLLGRKIVDIDIATAATPSDVIETLKRSHMKYSEQFKNYGVIVAQAGNKKIEVTTLREETYSTNRYPKVTFTKSVKTDSKRRDFTANTLYLSAKQGTILDFYQGQKDIKNKVLRFVGQPEQRIKEDPLRIIRALRFALNLHFRIEQKSFYAIKKYFLLIKNLSATRVETELKKVLSQKNKKIMQEVINNPLALDKYF